MNLMEHQFAMSDLYSGGCLLPPPLPPRSLTPPVPTPPSQVSHPSPCPHPFLPSILPIPLSLPLPSRSLAHPPVPTLCYGVGYPLQNILGTQTLDSMRMFCM